MKKKICKTIEGEEVVRWIPENEEDVNWLREKFGAEAGRHSFADGDGEPLDLDEYDGDAELGELTCEKSE